MGKRICHLGLIAGALVVFGVPVQAQSPSPQSPFTATMSNTAPLSFGMDQEAVAKALRAPLTYVKGKPGNEVFKAIWRVHGEGFLFRKDSLYLQFRKGRLTGWKGDWSRPWLRPWTVPARYGQP